VVFENKFIITKKMKNLFTAQVTNLIHQS